MPFIFTSEIPREDCSKEGVTLLFTVFDHDRMTENDIAGEVWYELQYVPGLGVPMTTGGFGTAPQIDMPLMIGELKGEVIDSKLYFTFSKEKTGLIEEQGLEISGFLEILYRSMPFLNIFSLNKS